MSGTTSLKSQFTDEQRRELKPHFIERNTIEYWRGRDRIIRLHSTDIVIWHPDGEAELNSGGWRTVTTKDRMNAQLRTIGCSVVSDKGTWYVRKSDQPWDDRAARVAYYDGIKVPRCFTFGAPHVLGVKALKREADLKRKINKLCKALTKDNMPQPDNGDCWICWMEREKIKKEIEAGHRQPRVKGADDPADHLQGHLDECYLHGSLIYNAIYWAGIREPGLYWQMGLWDMARRHLRRYLKAQFGLP